MYIIKKFKERYIQFIKHPLVEYPFLSLMKYIYINVKLRIKKKPMEIKWFNGLKFDMTWDGTDFFSVLRKKVLIK